MTKEVSSEYVLDDQTGEMKMVKQKINEKSIPPNIDIIKLIYQHYVEPKNDYSKLTDEELSKEKQRLLKELKESENASRKSKKQN